MQSTVHAAISMNYSSRFRLCRGNRAHLIHHSTSSMYFCHLGIVAQQPRFTHHAQIPMKCFGRRCYQAHKSHVWPRRTSRTRLLASDTRNTPTVELKHRSANSPRLGTKNFLSLDARYKFSSCLLRSSHQHSGNLSGVHLNYILS